MKSKMPTTMSSVPSTPKSRRPKKMTQRHQCYNSHSSNGFHRCCLSLFSSAVAILFVTASCGKCSAFNSNPSTSFVHRYPSKKSTQKLNRLEDLSSELSSNRQHKFIADSSLSSFTRLYSNSSNNSPNSYNLSKPTFDLLSLRPIRTDALLRYNTLNQSEPLRINLYLLATLTLLGYPLWCESVTGEIPTIYSIIAAAVGGAGSASLFWRERGRRDRQLRRMEKELNAESLEIRMPSSPVYEDKFSSVRRATVSLKELKSKRRIIALRGTKEALKEVSEMCFVLGRRFVQSQTLVVMVPSDGSTKEDWGWKDESNALWFAEPINIDDEGGWLNYFNELLGNDGNNKNDGNDKTELSGFNTSEKDLAWFALNFKGRSIASGVGEQPKLLELLGQQLQPMDILDENDSDQVSDVSGDPLAGQILECQRKFYGVLTDSSDELGMVPIFSSSSAVEVDEVVSGGGRIDNWNKCLEPGARPAGMTISGADVYIASPTLAYSTCIEFPPNAGFDSATLLAVQRWRRESVSGGGSGDWKLELHQTIPWSAGTRAGGTLRCDCRGCVALARAQERRTFGGLIG